MTDVVAQSGTMSHFVVADDRHQACVDNLLVLLELDEADTDTYDNTADMLCYHSFWRWRRPELPEEGIIASALACHNLTINDRQVVEVVAVFRDHYQLIQDILTHIQHRYSPMVPIDLRPYVDIECPILESYRGIIATLT